MSFSSLSLEQSPPYFVTMRFFLTSPIFLFFCGALLFFVDSGFFNLLAFVHCCTLGFLGFTFFGAIQQMLPVLAGVHIRANNLFSLSTYILLLIGVISLLIGFLGFDLAFYVAIIFLSLSIFLLVFIFLYKLMSVRFYTPTIIGIILALLSLFLLLIFGVARLMQYIGFNLVALSFDVVHVYFALFGLCFVLIGAICYQVLPMFYVAREYNATFKKIFLPLFSIIVFSVGMFRVTRFGDEILLIFELAIFVGTIFFSIYSFIILRSRRRKTLDASIRFWYLGFASLAASSIFWFVNLLIENFSKTILATLSKYAWVESMVANSQSIFILFIFIFLFGFVASIIIAMLYKIVPFLTYFHLSSSGNFEIPSAKEMVKEKMMMAHFYLHSLSLIFLILGVYFESGIFMGGATMMFSALVMIFSFIKTLVIYKNFCKGRT